MAFQPLRDFEDSYEIEVEEPHRIRRLGSDRFVSTSLDRLTGYMRVKLNGRTYKLHRILAKHFIENPDDLPQVDHIDRNKTNNSIENLRWVTASENTRNRTVAAYGRREYLNNPPNDITEIRTFNGVEYAENTYFFCYETDRVVKRFNDHRWQLLAQTPHYGYLRVHMTDINGRSHHVYVHKLIDHFRNQPAEEE